MPQRVRDTAKVKAFTHAAPVLRLHPREPLQRHTVRRGDERSARRLEQHRAGVEGFTRRYRVHRLVYLEEHASITEARAREHQSKKWRRAWKLQLIESVNPEWRDLSAELVSL
jgi:putative endonuclease